MSLGDMRLVNTYRRLMIRTLLRLLTWVFPTVLANIRKCGLTVRTLMYHGLELNMLVLRHRLDAVAKEANENEPVNKV